MKGSRFTLNDRTMAGLLVGLGMIANLAGCGGSSKTTPPPPTVSIAATSGSPQTATVSTAFAAPLVATVTTGGSATSGVTVTFAAPSSGASGTFAGGKNTATTDANGKATSAVFTANSTAGAYTVTASVSGASTPASFSLTNTAVTSTVSISATSGSGQVATAGVPFLAPLAATVMTNGTPTSGVTVTFSAPASGASGTFAGGVTTAKTNSSGVAVSPAFTANSTAGAYTVTATAPGASSPANFSLTNAAATLANGNYVFSLAGNDKANGTYFYAGAFAVVGGAITGGEQHFSDNVHLAFEPITSGTIAANADGTLAITLNFTDAYINSGAGTVTFDASLVTSTKALLTEYDSWATASGELDLQAASLATPSGSYAFNSTGLDHFGHPFSFGGVINVDGAGTISGTGSVVDVNDLCATNSGGCVAQVYPNQVVKTSTVSTPDAFGYVFFYLDFDCTVGVPDPELCGTLSVGTPAEIELDGYMIDSKHIRLIEFGNNDSLNGTTGGIAVGQSSTGTFNTASVSGSTYVIGSAGQDINGKLQVAGLLTFNSGGTVSGNLSFNDIVVQSPIGGDAISAGAYTVDSTGRVTVTGVTTTATPAFTYNLELYLTGDGHALVISMDSTAATVEELAGTGSQQTSTALTAASINGSYALDNAGFSGLNEQDGVGGFYGDGATSLTGFLDLNETFTTAAALVPDSTFSDIFATTATSGLFTVTVTPTGASPTPFTMYLVDNTQGVMIENDAVQLTLGLFELKH
jgi:hypothetical protein